jgi:hypothetical protein
MDNEQGGQDESREYHPEHRAQDWSVALVTVCLALGFAISWAGYEVRQRLAQEASVVHFRHDLDMLSSQQSDLGQLLADPRTKLIRMSPVDGAWAVADACVAWNGERQSGILFCRMLNESEGQKFKLWLIPTVGPAAGADIGPAEVGKSVYPFNTIGSAESPARIELTNWTNTDQPSGLTLARGELHSD